LNAVEQTQENLIDTQSLPPVPQPGPAPINVRALFKVMADLHASDLFFSCNSPIKIKIDGRIRSVNKHVLLPIQMKQTAYSIMSPAQIEQFEREREIDFAISERGLGRFRANVFLQRGLPAMVLRYIAQEIPKLDGLGLPGVLVELSMLKRGLVLMVGATGSGKSTTLAAMINHRNENAADHIVTIEDPIEFLHTHKLSVVNQREVGFDTKSFDNALRSVMRAAPDVILVGEVRDLDSMQAAINLAGTGHLVLATLHANNSPETLDRIINMFPASHHKQLMLDLSQYLRAILAQRLVVGVNQKRVAAMEVMLNTPHISELVKRGDVTAIKEAIASSSESGVQSFDMALLGLYRDGRIGLEEALRNADSRSNMEARINFG
jgi:twitching motility protein PilU